MIVDMNDNISSLLSSASYTLLPLKSQTETKFHTESRSWERSPLEDKWSNGELADIMIKRSWKERCTFCRALNPDFPLLSLPLSAQRVGCKSVLVYTTAVSMEKGGSNYPKFPSFDRACTKAVEVKLAIKDLALCFDLRDLTWHQDPFVCYSESSPQHLIV